MTYTVSVYKSGNSKVMTIPADLPIEVGDVMELTSITGKNTQFILQKQKAISKNLTKVNAILDAMPKFSHGLSPKKLNKYLEHMYE